MQTPSPDRSTPQRATSLGEAIPAVQPAWRQEIVREVSLADQCRQRYLPLPVEIPPDTASVQIDLAVEDPDGAEPAAIDLGCEGLDGWRGWSGGARSRIVIGAEDATPGYLPGALEPGTWSVILGLHALPAGRARARVTISSPASDRPDHGHRPVPVRRERGSARSLPAPDGFTWIAADTHAHSLHSDGELGLHALAACAVEMGVDALCVTDHSTVSHHALLSEAAEDQGIVLVPGQGITTHRGHANAYGDIGLIDPRLPVTDWAREVAARGGLLSINHPVAGDCSWLEEVPAQVGGIEILHGEQLGAPLSTAAFAWTQQVIAARGGPQRAGISLLGGADFHRPSDPVRPGTPTTWLCVEELSVAGVLEAMRAGRTALTLCAERAAAGHAVPRLLDCPIALRRDPARLHIEAADGHVLVDARGRRCLVTGSQSVVEAGLEHGPFRLEDAGRRSVAVVA